MKDENDDSLDSLGCDRLVGAGGSQVAIWRSVRKIYDALDTQMQGRFERYMELWCNETKLPDTMFNQNEGRSKGGVMLRAFKAFKVRLYGFDRKVVGVRTFVIVDIDPAKKQNKADPGILKRAKSRVDDLSEGKNR